MTMAIDLIYWLSCLLSAAALISGLQVLWIGTWQKDSFFQTRHWLYAALSLSILLSVCYIPLAIQWTLLDNELSGPTAFNKRWALFHLLDRAVVLVFHWHVRRRAVEWREAMKKYGRDRRYLKGKLEAWA